MQAILYSFVWLVDRIRSLFGMIFPIFAEAADFRTWPKWLRIVVHVIIIGVILGLLYLLNQSDSVMKYLQRLVSVSFAPYFLATIFLLTYMLSWVVYFWWQLFNRSDEPEYPDILQAWTEATEKLRSERIDIGDLPLFLVLGEPLAGDDALILYSSGFAAERKLSFRVPQDGSAVIRLYGGQAGLFVTCGRASTWGSLCRQVAEPDAAGLPTDAGSSRSGGATLDFNQVLDPADKKEFFSLRDKGNSRTSEETVRYEELGRKINESGQSEAPQRVGLSQEALEEGPKRLAYLCRLIAESRRPTCPLNGVLIVVPFGTLTTEEASTLAVRVLSEDLKTIRVNIGQEYPHVVMVSDLEEIPGFHAVRAGFRADALKSRIGTTIPVVPDHAPAELPKMLNRVTDHIRQNSLTGWLIDFLRTTWPSESRTDVDFVPPLNQQLFRFQYSLHKNIHRLGRILTRGMPCDPTSQDPVAASPLLAGCYIASARKPKPGDGDVAEAPQAFVPGVFNKLRESQSQVRWTAEALAEDARQKWIARALYLLAAGFIVLNLVLGWWIKNRIDFNS